MNREIKFRTFKNNKMIYFDLHNWETLRALAAFPGNYEVLSFTGLEDKNGIEIYEGDIIRLHQFLFDGNEVECESIGLIKYMAPSFCLTQIRSNWIEEYTGFEKGEASIPLTDFYGLHEESFEIIGSKFENPELLEKVK